MLTYLLCRLLVPASISTENSIFFFKFCYLLFFDSTMISAVKSLFLFLFLQMENYKMKCLTLSIPHVVTPKCVLLQTVKTQMKCHTKQHLIWVYTVLYDKTIFRERNTILFENYNLLPLEIHNGPSQIYCIKPEGRIH